RQLGGLADIETPNASMRDRTAKNLAGQDAWECHIISVDHAPGDAIDSIGLGNAFAQECVIRHAASPLCVHCALWLSAGIKRSVMQWLPYHVGLGLSTGGLERGAGQIGYALSSLLSKGACWGGIERAALWNTWRSVRHTAMGVSHLRRTVMKRSTDRILTTFVGSLARPLDLLEMMYAREHGQPYNQEAYAGRVRSAVADVVRQQVEAGVDIVCDGEQGKPGFSVYVSERLAGFEPRETTSPAGPWAGSREALAFPEYYQWYARGRPGSVAAPFGRACTGPISYKGQAALQTDIDNLTAALQGLRAEEVFMPAVAPTTIEPSRRNEYYPTQEAYLYAIAEAMREEYHGIVDAGFLLQIDDPRLVTSYGSHPGMDLEEFLKWAELWVE